MAITEETMPNKNNISTKFETKTSAPKNNNQSYRPSGVQGTIALRPSDAHYDSDSIVDEMEYGRIVKIIKAEKK